MNEQRGRYGFWLHLNSVHRTGGEGGVGERQSGTQQVADSFKVVLVLLDGLNAHPVFRQQSLEARGITRRGQELEVSMTTTQEETSSEVTNKAGSLSM